MKHLLSTLVVAVIVWTPICYADPLALEREFGKEMMQIRNLYPALLAYDADFSKFPPHLIELVTNGNIKADSILIRQRDGSVILPAYFPGKSSANKPETILVTYDLPNHDKRIVLNVKGEVKIEIKPNGEQAAPSNP
jgi:hypothetical protein